MANQKHQPYRGKLKIKKGDLVRVNTGKFRNTVGEVLQVLPREQRVVVDKVNVVLRHTKATEASAGGRLEKLLSIHVSNVALVDPSNENSTTRVGRRMEDGKLVRYAKSNGQTLAS